MNLQHFGLKYTKLILGEERYLKYFRPFLLCILSTPYELVRKLRLFSYELLRADSIRSLVLRVRYIVLVKVRRCLRTSTNASEGVSENTVKYNLAILSTYPLLLRRTRLLIRPFSVIGTLTSESSILVIGPRSEDDILHLMAYGFWKVKGLDLISYSPHVDLGDMHDMPYGNDMFKGVILGWVLSYSNNPQQVAKEVLRVAKDGAVIGIGAERLLVDREEFLRQVSEKLGYAVGGAMVNTVSEHLELFAGFVKEVYFVHDIRSEQDDRTANMCVIFSIKK